ncbi:hypothetical protein ANCCAN_01460 [Ancylostoma caninum]|uniref:Uncharacterized protein n=1 Tax=Ancylostoma caninum TaxID=29170 RepID=A0A368HAR8_ANCCA|nr:hypothetical protein ANCCAN_01460 [Ancylostoma caninum]
MKWFAIALCVYLFCVGLIESAPSWGLVTSGQPWDNETEQQAEVRQEIVQGLKSFQKSRASQTKKTRLSKNTVGMDKRRIFRKGAKKEWEKS